jgi:hypothetical protein
MNKEYKDILLEMGYISKTNTKKSINEASIFDSKYSSGDRFLSLTNTKELFSKGIPNGKKIPKGPFTKENETNDYIEVNIGNGPTVFVSADDTDKTYKITASKSQFQSLFGKMKASKNSSIPQDAAYYEMGICVEYNKSKGMNIDDAMKAASVDPKKYQKYEKHFEEVLPKVIKNLPDMGSSLRQTGGDSEAPSSEWPSSDSTPKTDIFGGSDHRVSVKKAGGSQLASGGAGDAKGLFLGGLSFYEEHSSNKAAKHLQQVVKEIESGFKRFNTDNSVGEVRKKAADAYVEWRIPQLKKQTKAKKEDIKKHAKAEVIGIGIAAERGKWENWLLDDVDVIEEREIMKWFDEYWKSQGSEELQSEIRDIVTTAIDHKKLDTTLKKAFDDPEFKKWVVYEASSGNFKFSGDSDLKSNNDPIANEILVFGLDGSVKVDDINENWASGYASNVSPTVNFKSSSRSKYTALRLIQSHKDNQINNMYDFQNDLSNIIDEEIKSISNMINESVEYLFDPINEINFKQILSNIKNIARKLMKKIVDSIKKLYTNVVKKVITKLKEYIKLGMTKFLEYLGIEIDGSAELTINF